MPPRTFVYHQILEAYSIRGVSLRDYIQQATTGDANAIERYIAGTLIVEQVLALQASQEILYGDGDGGVIKRELPRLREVIEQGAYRRLLPAFVRRFLENSTPLVNIGFTGSLDSFFAFHTLKAGSLDWLLPCSTVKAYLLEKKPSCFSNIGDNFVGQTLYFYSRGLSTDDPIDSFEGERRKRGWWVWRSRPSLELVEGEPSETIQSKRYQPLKGL